MEIRPDLNRLEPGPWGQEGVFPTTVNLGPYQKCTYGFGPVNEPLSLDQTNMSMVVSYTYDGKNYTDSSPPLTDLENDSRTWQFDGNKWIFAEQNTVAVPEFPFAASLISSIVIISRFFDSAPFHRKNIEKRTMSEA